MTLTNEIWCMLAQASLSLRRKRSTRAILNFHKLKSNVPQITLQKSLQWSNITLDSILDEFISLEACVCSHRSWLDAYQHRWDPTSPQIWAEIPSKSKNSALQFPNALPKISLMVKSEYLRYRLARFCQNPGCQFPSELPKTLQIDLWGLHPFLKSPRN